MKLTITRKELKAMIFKEFGTEINVDIEIEGYIQQPTKNAIEIGLERIQQNSIYGARPELPRRTTTVDKDGFVTDIKDDIDRDLDLHARKEIKKPTANIKNKWVGNLDNKPDYEPYENTVLDFATSNEHKRQVPFFDDITIECAKARYQKMIKELNVEKSVKFSSKKNLPYLVRIEGTVDMAKELKEGTING